MHLSKVYTDLNQQSKIAFATTEDGTRIELIEPLNDQGPVAGILQRKRGGLHYLCFVATSFEDDIKRFQQNHCLMIAPPKPAIAFNNRHVVFFYTTTFEVFELLEEEGKYSA